MKKKKTTVRKHPRQTKGGRTSVKRHSRYNPKRKRSKKILDARMTKSFETLAKNGSREYGTGMDLDKGTNKRFVEKTDELYRGTTRKETENNRASTQVPHGTDVTIHTHPKSSSDAQDRWTRPSGTDVWIMMDRQINKGDLDEAYVIGPDGQWVRYFVDVKDSDEDTALWRQFKEYTPREFDTMIEKQYREFHLREQKISHLDYQSREDYFAADPNSKEETAIFNRKVVKDRKKKMHATEDLSKEIDKIATRRAWKVFQSWINTAWNVRIEKVQKNKDKSITMTYMEEKV